MSWDQESDAYWLSHPGTRHTSPILHSDFRGKAFSLKLLSMMFVVAFQIMLRQFYSWFVEWFGFCFFVYLFICFFVMKVLNFVRFILCISWNGFAVFSLYSVNEVPYIDWFSCVEPSLHSRNKSHLVVVYNLCNMLLNLIY